MTSYWRRRSVHWRPLQGLLGCLGPNPATTDCIMWRRLFVLVNVCPRALRHFLDDILLLEALTGRVFRTAGVGFKRPPCISLFRGFFLSWLFNFMYFPSVQFSLTSLFSWDCWDPDTLVTQVLFALPAALFSLVRFAHLLYYCACICTSSYFLVVTLYTSCICSFVRNPFYKLAWFYLQFVLCILYCDYISFRCTRAWPIRPRRGRFRDRQGPR